MDELREKVKEFSHIKEKLMEAIKMQFQNGVQSIDVEEMGKVVDMVKDLCEAEKNCYKACYYKSCIEQMQGGGEQSPSHRGRRMGYSGGGSSGNPSGGGNSGGMGGGASNGGNAGFTPYDYDGRFGESYERFKDSRRNYGYTKSKIDKEDMDRCARECLYETFEALRDIVKGSEPELRHRMKNELSSFMNEVSL